MDRTTPSQRAEHNPLFLYETWRRNGIPGLLAVPFVRIFVKYFIAGGICAATDLAVFSLLFYTTGLDIMICATISFVVSTGLNYVLSARYVFARGSRPASHAIVMVYVASGLGLVANLGALWVAYDLMGLHPVLSKVAGIGASFLWNFSIRFFVIFR